MKPSHLVFDSHHSEMETGPNDLERRHYIYHSTNYYKQLIHLVLRREICFKTELSAWCHQFSVK